MFVGHHGTEWPRPDREQALTHGDLEGPTAHERRHQHCRRGHQRHSGNLEENDRLTRTEEDAGDRCGRRDRPGDGHDPSLEPKPLEIQRKLIVLQLHGRPTVYCGVIIELY
jgi:hypothetical protein